MKQPQSMREEVIARLTIRHGMSSEAAAAAWEEYLLLLLGRHLGQKSARDHIGRN
jgi:hypothetical protein